MPGEEGDIWALEQLQPDPEHVAPLNSWERSRDRLFREPVTAYFSESGARGFDAALGYQAKTEGLVSSGHLVRDEAFIRSLLRLGLGWSSSFFRYNEQTKKFERYMKDARVSGISLQALDGVVGDVLKCGTYMQRVRSFARNPPAKCKELSALFTLSSATSVVVYNLEQQVLDHSKHIVSLLQIQALFQRCGDLVGAMAGIIDAAVQGVSEAQVISIVMERASFFAHKFGWMENLVREIVLRTWQPWLHFVEHWIGLRPQESALDESMASSATFVQVEHHEEPGKFKTGPARIDYRYRADFMPSFIPTDQAQSIFESGKGLRLLKRSHPHHPIARHDVLARASPLHLQFATSWADIERIQQRAYEYESQLRAEIMMYHNAESCSFETKPEPSAIVDEMDERKEFKDTFELFDIDDEKHVSGPVTDRTAVSNAKFSRLCEKARSLNSDFIEDGSRFGPELTSALYLSLAPVISSQGLLIDYSCLHHLFKEHELRHHLNLQWRFQLLGDGSFVWRLSNSLFDPEMESGEHKRGVVRSGVHTGLRLGSRDSDTWPPASSELRLVLIGLLGDCYFSGRDGEASEKESSQGENDLPGGLSFAIRELSPHEIAFAKDPDAIEALDFLRLQYKPPEVLEAVITERSLNKYDRLFKQLLRLLRMISVVKGLIRDSTVRGSLTGDTRNVFQKFRVDAQHFVLAVSDYCFQIGIRSQWQHFQETLSKIESCLDRGDIDGTIEAAHSVARLRDYHEDVLDQMLFAFFLSKRHAQAARLLDSIFGSILAFSPFSRAEGLSGLRHESEDTVLHLYTTFRKHVAAFVGYLRGLDAGKASKSLRRSGALFTSRTEQTSVFEHLRVRLDVKEYY